MQTDDPRERGTGSTVPLQTLLGTVAGGNPLHHKAARGLLLGRRPILFGTVASRRRRRTGGRRLGFMAVHTVVRQIEGTELIDK
jgi:hypothetical protein